MPSLLGLLATSTGRQLALEPVGEVEAGGDRVRRDEFLDQVERQGLRVRVVVQAGRVVTGDSVTEAGRVVGKVSKRAVFDLDEAVCVRQQNLAGWGEPNLSRTPDQQLHAELALEGLYPLRERYTSATSSDTQIRILGPTPAVI